MAKEGILINKSSLCKTGVRFQQVRHEWIHCGTGKSTTQRLEMGRIPAASTVFVTRDFLEIFASQDNCIQLVIYGDGTDVKDTISSPHAEIFYERERSCFCLRHFEDNFDTFLNGDKLDSNKKWGLQTGDVLSFGKKQSYADFVFHLREASSSTQQPTLENILLGSAFLDEDDLVLLGWLIAYNPVVLERICSFLSIPELKRFRKVNKLCHDVASPMLFRNCIFQIPTSVAEGVVDDRATWQNLEVDANDRYRRLLCISDVALAISLDDTEERNAKARWFLRTFCAGVRTFRITIFDNNHMDIKTWLLQLQSPTQLCVRLAYGPTDVQALSGSLDAVDFGGSTFPSIQQLSIRRDGIKVDIQNFVRSLLRACPNLKKLSVFTVRREENHLSTLFSVSDFTGMGFNLPHWQDVEDPRVWPDVTCLEELKIEHTLPSVRAEIYVAP